MLIEQPLPQYRVGGFSQRVPLAHAQRAVLAEEIRDHPVGRGFELQDSVEEFGGKFDKSVGVHPVDYR
jgi:hypothetical protein